MLTEVPFSSCDAHNLQQDAFQCRRLAATSNRTLESDDRVSRTAEPSLSVNIMAGLEFMRFRPDCYMISTTNCLSSRRLMLTSGTDLRDLLIFAILQFPISTIAIIHQLRCCVNCRADSDRMVSSVLFLTVEEWGHRMGDVGRKIAREEGDFG